MHSQATQRCVATTIQISMCLLCVRAGVDLYGMPSFPTISGCMPIKLAQCSTGLPGNLLCVRAGVDQYGMPSFPTILRRIAQLWSTKREDLEEQASTIMGQLEEFTSSPPASPGTAAAAAAAVDPKQLLAAVRGCAKSLMKGYDPKLGGFGGPPKFPRPSEINLLLRAATEQAAIGGKGGGKVGSMAGSKALSAQQLLQASLHSLQVMAAGGMYDQLGGGFHRYR
eukprot:GHRQ01010062.1.p2 GENE.GHRQ01010062.1~~GHRQ01010062.1.p2  ORF type:complete len:225 (+),score=104.38 GHRQ01010062.1:1093-1767(+)